jgi:hypothetical protein
VIYIVTQSIVCCHCSHCCPIATERRHRYPIYSVPVVLIVAPLLQKATLLPNLLSAAIVLIVVPLLQKGEELPAEEEEEEEGDTGHDTKCKECKNDGELLLCDFCQYAFHLECLNPALPVRILCSL